MNHSLVRRILFATTILIVCLSFIPAQAQDDVPLVIVLTADGPVSPAMA
jgi:hypothetical protein